MSDKGNSWNSKPTMIGPFYGFYDEIADQQAEAANRALRHQDAVVARLRKAWLEGCCVGLALGFGLLALALWWLGGVR